MPADSSASSNIGRPVMHRSAVLNTPATPGSPISIDAFIEQQRADAGAAQLATILTFAAKLHEKLLSEQARGHGDLHDGVRRLLKVVEGHADAQDPLPDAVAEAVVALHYVLKGADVIPDWVPEIGLTDDARVIARVIERNPQLIEAPAG